MRCEVCGEETLDPYRPLFVSRRQLKHIRGVTCSSKCSDLWFERQEKLDKEALWRIQFDLYEGYEKDILR
jgi:hypothetical protein